MYLGDYPELHNPVACFFTTHDSNGAPVAPSTAFDLADVRIYRSNSATQRASTAGMTITSPFDTTTGLHALAIDLSNNDDAGFYAQGNVYTIVLAPDDETVDGVAVVKVIGTFTISVGLHSTVAYRKILIDGSGTANANVVSMAASTITNTAIATSAATEIADAVWDTDATTHQIQGSFGQTIGDSTTSTETIFKAVVTDAAGDNVGADTTAILADTVQIESDVAAILVDTGTSGVVVASINNNAITAASIATDAGAEIADAVLDRNMATGADSGSDSVRTPRQALRSLRNKVSIAGGTITITKEDDTTSSWTGAVTTTAGNPISAIDPAGP